MKKILFLAILFFSGLLFSCCPEKKNKQNRSSEIVQVDFSHFKTIHKEKGSNIPEDHFELTEDCSEREFGPV